MSSGKVGGNSFGEAISRGQNADGGGLDLVNGGFVRLKKVGLSISQLAPPLRVIKHDFKLIRLNICMYWA